MPGFIESAAEGAYRHALDRVRRGLDRDLDDPRPEIDLKQQREFREERAGGRESDAYRQALEYHGFAWHPPEALPLANGVAQEGQWRHEGLRMGFTPSDLTMGFPGGPEQFDRHVREELLKRRMRRRGATKAEVRRELARK